MKTNRIYANIHPEPGDVVRAHLVGDLDAPGSFVTIELFGAKLYLDISEEGYRLTVADFRRDLNQAIDRALRPKDEEK